MRKKIVRAISAMLWRCSRHDKGWCSLLPRALGPAPGHGKRRLSRADLLPVATPGSPRRPRQPQPWSPPASASSGSLDLGLSSLARSSASSASSGDLLRRIRDRTSQLREFNRSRSTASKAFRVASSLRPRQRHSAVRFLPVHRTWAENRVTKPECSTSDSAGCVFSNS